MRPDDLDAEDERRLDGEPRDALADVDVQVVERRRGDIDQHLARAGLRIGDILELEAVQPAELVEHDCLHALASSLAMSVYV